MRDLILLVSTVALLTGCATTTTHYGKKPPLEKLEIGMTREQVVSVMGSPATVSSQFSSTYLEYGWDDPFDGRIGPAELYFVRLIDGKTESFGVKGDFDSTKKSPTDININQKITSTQGGSGDLLTELTKLKQLLDSKAITQDEYESLKAKTIAK